MAEYGSQDVVCPYYCRSDKNRICCEGLEYRNTINLVFEDSSATERYREHFCNRIDNYKSCRVCDMLNRKYAEEE